ncbi:lysostaphin resistance A-like protein [Microbacterium sp.]|uniref:CPBP family intramembrane glutamic endopeptidase n=1 Tax=Microbacterium sp. TaxID=51671 RepID=UPI0039E6C59B
MVVRGTKSTAERRGDPRQLSLRNILLTWLAATAPTAILVWGVWPILRAATTLNPGMLFWLLMICGMVWQFVFSLILLRRELGTLRWSVVAPRVWAQQPRDPRTNAPRPRLWWMIVPIAAAFAALTLTADLLVSLMEAAGLTELKGAAISGLADPAFTGQWWILVVALVSFVFNYVLGEELFFRGVLLPRMRGAFGRWDWLANAILFTLYHTQKLWTLPVVLLTAMPFSWAARRYRTIWFAIVLHSIEGVVVLVLVFTVVSGLAFS